MKQLLMILPLALVLCFMVGCQDKAAMTELEEFKAQAEVEEQNKLKVKQLLEEMNKQNFDIRDEITSSDYEYYFPPNGKSKNYEERKKSTQANFSAFPDLHYEIEGIFTDNNIVVVSTLATATHKGEFMGLPPSDKEIACNTIAIMQFEEGKLVKEWLLVDLLSLMQQLGMELKPKEGER